MNSAVEYSPVGAFRSLAEKSGLDIKGVIQLAQRNQLHRAVELANSRRGRPASVRNRGGGGQTATRGRKTMNSRNALALARALSKDDLLP